MQVKTVTNIYSIETGKDQQIYFPDWILFVKFVTSSPFPLKGLKSYCSLITINHQEMKYILYSFFLFSIGMLIVPEACGQNNTARLDSVPVIKPKMNQDLYLFTDSGGTEIQFWKRQPVIFKGKRPMRDFGNELLTLATGFGFVSANDVIWEVYGKIECNDALPEWHTKLFCEGTMIKDRQRVREADGSWSLETDKTKVLFWDKNATGSVLEGADTIGFFLFIMDPLQNTILKPWANEIFSQKNTQAIPASKSKWSFDQMYYRDVDYGIIGTFRDKKFAIISNGSTFKTWIYIQNEFKCIFRADVDDNMISKKDRVMPYLLIDQNIPEMERRDLLRLAIMSRFINQAMNTSF